jgi:prepilin-type N-terminal cleavage/methylation domain-containing protein
MKQKAFTLIEIMIVISIIGLLMCIAIPNFARSQRTAKMQTCISNLYHIEMATQQWAMETRQGDTSAVAPADVLPYLQGTVVCPSGGKTFVDSYFLTTVNVKPTCLKVPGTHKLSDDTTQ